MKKFHSLCFVVRQIVIQHLVLSRDETRHAHDVAQPTDAATSQRERVEHAFPEEKRTDLKIFHGDVHVHVLCMRFYSGNSQFSSHVVVLKAEQTGDGHQREDVRYSQRVFLRRFQTLHLQTNVCVAQEPGHPEAIDEPADPE